MPALAWSIDLPSNFHLLCSLGLLGHSFTFSLRMPLRKVMAATFSWICVWNSKGSGLSLKDVIPLPSSAESSWLSNVSSCIFPHCEINHMCIRSLSAAPSNKPVYPACGRLSESGSSQFFQGQRRAFEHTCPIDLYLVHTSCTLAFFFLQRFLGTVVHWSREDSVQAESRHSSI